MFAPDFAFYPKTMRRANEQLGKAVLLLSVLLWAFVFPPWAFACDAVGSSTPIIWGGGNGNWFAGNWFCFVGGFPVSAAAPNGSGFTANIGTGSSSPITGTVTLNGPVNLPDGIALGSGAPGGLIVNSASNTLAAGTMDIGFSDPGTSTLAISGGGVLTDNFVFVGGLAGSSGSATVSGTGSQWNVSTQFIVGDNGQGTRNIQSGGHVSSNNASVGYIGGSSGQVSIRGVGSQWDNSGDLTVASGGRGPLMIQHGGVVSNINAIVGAVAGSNGTVLVDDANWTNTGTLDIGVIGTGEVTLKDKGHLTAAARPSAATVAWRSIPP